ncbi:branched chain amino acid ABC transporter substrate-binding protein [Planomonospora parontospora subsp. parontospora]|uniref:Branched chain amino acid ABC transporter substrate-binding protein n=2 Tax=Planomonospora parontospora TaxID=58119 RepID=A0AA37BBU4_9ACTN|nr:branched-chain amino acid ABC transporter substrate-binding protein [Planomonospora parontospora]GGK48502.1 branched chain amino acid ABC transporter substrate-binding protein [Planomonospora parontospora]GII06713.1 branched chain amino acid ABC transporter substrate-binding protein [Planomonospora parontospora subsp. parontospora]
MALALGLAACGNGGSETTPADGGSNAAAPGTVKIGFMGDLTGANAGIVIPPRNGAKLAIDQYNKTNPAVKIELVEYDSQADPSKAVALAQQAIKTDKIVGLVGPAFSGESAQVGPVLEEAKLPSISASATNVKLAENGWKYWHRVLPNDGVQGPGIADFIAGGAAAKNVFVIDDKSEYGKPLADAVRAQLATKGVKVTNDSLDPAESDFSSVANKVAAAKPDAIFFGGYYAAGGNLLKQLRDKNVDAKFLSGDGSLDKGLIEGAGADNAEGALIGCPCYIATPDVTDAKVKGFADAYKAAYNADPAIYASEGFDAATVFIEAVKAGKTTPEDINQFISTVDIAGVSKQVKFAPNGEVEAKDIYIYQVKGGAITLLGKAAEAKLG